MKLSTLCFDLFSFLGERERESQAGGMEEKKYFGLKTIWLEEKKK